VLVIFDEIDSFLLEDADTFTALQALFKPLHKLLGLTGSDLKEFHIKAIEQIACCPLIRMGSGS
jgi:hypothetical protein